MGIFSKLFGKKDKKVTDAAPDNEAVTKNDTQKAEEEQSTVSEISAPVEKKEIKKQETSCKPAETAAKPASVEPTSKSRIPTGFFEIKKSKDNRYVFNLYAANRVIIATSQIYSSSQAAQNGINSVIANAEKSPIEDNTLKNPTSQPFPKWEIYKDKADQFRFRLFASNGSCICHSQGYTSKANCKNGIESIIKTVKNASVDKSYLVKK